MIDLKRPISELAAEVRRGKVKAQELVKTSLEMMALTDNFHTVLEVSERAMEQAKEIDQDPKGRLAGIPFIAKDNFLTLHTKTTAASNILDGNNPFQAPYQATAIERLEAEGAIMVAKANLDAFAHGSSTENSDFGPTKNPHDETRVPGGSSGGSAAAVALGQACFALGTDTGGSIRLPASYCGVVGLKPTYGLVSRFGVIAMASSTDVIGPLANSVEDAGLVLEVMAGVDPMDSTTLSAHFTAPDNYTLKGKRIGLVKEYMGAGVDEAIRSNITSVAGQLEAAGAIVKEVSLPSVELALACYYILVPAEVSSNLARYDGVKYGHSSKQAQSLLETYELSREEGFGIEAKRRILTGTYVLSSGYYDAYYKQAQKVRTLIVKEFERAFNDFDLLLSPTAPTVAFGLGQKAADPLSMYMNDVLTVAVNLVGGAAISIPSGRHNDLPIGTQLIAPQQGETELVGAARQLEQLLEARL